MSKDDLEVTERPYSAHQQGPGADSGAVGADDRLLDPDWRPADGPKQQQGTPLFAKKVRRPTQNPEVHDAGGGRPPWLIAGAIGAGALLFLLVLVGLWLSLAGGTEGPRADPDGDERYQGIEVKKGFQ